MIALSDYYPGADDDAPREPQSLTSIALQLEQASRCDDGREWIPPPKRRPPTLTEKAEFEARLRYSERKRRKSAEARERLRSIVEDEESGVLRGMTWVSPRIAAGEIDYVVWRLA